MPKHLDIVMSDGVGGEALRKIAKEIPNGQIIQESIQTLIEDMLFMCERSGFVGLAAP